MMGSRHDLVEMQRPRATHLVETRMPMSLFAVGLRQRRQSREK